MFLIRLLIKKAQLLIRVLMFLINAATNHEVPNETTNKEVLIVDEGDNFMQEGSNVGDNVVEEGVVQDDHMMQAGVTTTRISVMQGSDTFGQVGSSIGRGLNQFMMKLNKVLKQFYKGVTSQIQVRVKM